MGSSNSVESCEEKHIETSVETRSMRKQHTQDTMSIAERVKSRRKRVLTKNQNNKQRDKRI